MNKTKDITVVADFTFEVIHFFNKQNTINLASVTVSDTTFLKDWQLLLNTWLEKEWRNNKNKCLKNTGNIRTDEQWVLFRALLCYPLFRGSNLSQEVSIRCLLFDVTSCYFLLHCNCFSQTVNVISCHVVQPWLQRLQKRNMQLPVLEILCTENTA